MPSRRELLAGLAALPLAGCLDWLEVDDGSDSVPLPATPPREPVFLPDEPARVDGRGPLVPATPGLRVPDGYWTRVRLDVADFFLPYTWVSLLPHDGRVTLRLEAIGGPLTPTGAAPLPLLRAVVPIVVPEGTKIYELGGLTLQLDALREATAVMRTTPSDTWFLDLTRLTLEEMGSTAVKGSLEGSARRGSRSPTSRTMQGGFVGLWARAPR